MTTAARTGCRWEAGPRRWRRRRGWEQGAQAGVHLRRCDRRKPTTLITTGAAQSNQARLTAAAGARLGLDVILVLAGEPDGPMGGNLALDGLFGARVQWAGDDELEGLADKLARQLGERGVIAEVIPFGGSSVAGARGYVECGRELLEQAPDLAQVVVAVGSGVTMAGLVHSLTAQRVIGVHTGAAPDPHHRVQRFVDGLDTASEATGSDTPFGHPDAMTFAAGELTSTA